MILSMDLLLAKFGRITMVVMCCCSLMSRSCNDLLQVRGSFRIESSSPMLRRVFSTRKPGQTNVRIPS
jgi:hypothetical protein